MNVLELMHKKTGDVYHIETNHYGIVMEKFQKLARAISDEWVLLVRTRLGEIIHRSQYYEVQG